MTSRSRVKAKARKVASLNRTADSFAGDSKGSARPVATELPAPDPNDRAAKVQELLDRVQLMVIQQLRPKEGLALIEELLPAEQDYGRAKILRLVAVGLLGREPEFDSLLADLMTDPSLHPHLRRHCLFLQGAGRLSVSNDTLRLLWGHLPEYSFAALGDLEPSVMNSAHLASILATVLEAGA